MFILALFEHRLKEWCCEWRDFVELMLKKPQELKEEVAYERMKNLINRGRTLFKDFQHRENVKRFSSTLSLFVQNQILAFDSFQNSQQIVSQNVARHTHIIGEYSH